MCARFLSTSAIVQLYLQMPAGHVLQHPVEPCMPFVVKTRAGMQLISQCSNHDQHGSKRIPFSLEDLQCMHAGLPEALRPELLLLLPGIVDSGEHTRAARELLLALGSAAGAAFACTGPLRLPGIAALASLRLDESLVDDVLSIVLAVRAASALHLSCQLVLLHADSLVTPLWDFLGAQKNSADKMGVGRSAKSLRVSSQWYVIGACISSCEACMLFDTLSLS